MRIPTASVLFLALGSAFSNASAQVTFNFSTGTPNNLMAMASRPDFTGHFEIETADDFVLTQTTTLNSATFTGLLPSFNSSVAGVTVEIYRGFPYDSSTVRTPNVPTRTNSPSDAAFDSRSGGDSNLTFSTSVLSATFTALNSIQPGGIHPSPNQTTGGNGPITGAEVQFNVSFTTPFTLAADHYFFIPQVQLTNGDFYWLSASRPISGFGSTPFAPDLQAWTRDANLDPDWLRVGTDIVGGATPQTFNAAFTLSGVTGASTAAVPEPATYGLVGAAALVGLALVRRRKAKLTGERLDASKGN
jgi:hypothetical protein